ncbi:glycoside hydrolase family 127 protein [Streptomyces sp. YIM S03343]
MSGPVAPTVTASGVLHPLPHTAVTLDSAGWLGEWQQLNRTTTIPHVLTEVEDGEAYSNLARLVGDSQEPWHMPFFSDSDVYKTLEAIAWAAPNLAPGDPTLERATRLVELLERAQEADGYLNSYVQGTDTATRWADPQWGHELYCAGHLFQAAVAAARTDALPGLLDVARRFADHLVARFGPDAPAYVEGHPEVETALVELYRTTGDTSYLDLARRQLEARGHHRLGESLFGSAYFQDHRPVSDGGPATGHAVRQLYLLTGAVDIAVETGDPQLLDAVLRTWRDLVETKTYITGAHGSRHRDESIGDPYELPADRAYAETCAAIAGFHLNWRLLLATGDARHADEMETALYNAIAVSTSVDGTAFFYSNPLHLRTGHEGGHEDAPSARRPWYAVACCPPNIARLLATAHDYLATTDPTGVQIHHYAAGTIRTTVGDGTATLTVATGYPYSPTTTLAVDATSTGTWELALRIPAWCTSWTLHTDGRPADATSHNGYLRIRRPWHDHRHVVALTLDMPVTLISPHPRVDSVRGCRAITRGPLVYALETADLPAGVVLEDLSLHDIQGPPSDATSTAGIIVRLRHHPADHAPLYRPVPGSVAPANQDRVLTVPAIPYHRWGNRGQGAMRVWIPTAHT